MELARRVVADPDDRVDREQSSEIADGPSQRSEDAQLRAIVAIVTVERIADDLATTLLLATDKPVVIAPAMNVRMWLHAATQRNIAQLKADGVRVIEPAEGEMACGEFGPGRLPEPQDIMDQLADLLK